MFHTNSGSIWPLFCSTHCNHSHYYIATHSVLSVLFCSTPHIPPGIQGHYIFFIILDYWWLFLFGMKLYHTIESHLIQERYTLNFFMRPDIFYLLSLFFVSLDTQVQTVWMSTDFTLTLAPFPNMSIIFLL